MYKTLSEVRQNHKGYWFKNKRRGQEGFIGNLRKNQTFITWEACEFSQGIVYKLWKVTATNQDTEINYRGTYPTKNEAIEQAKKL